MNYKQKSDNITLRKGERVEIAERIITVASTLLILDMACYLVLVARKNDCVRQANERLATSPRLFEDQEREIRGEVWKRVRAYERWERIFLAPLKVFWRFL